MHFFIASPDLRWRISHPIFIAFYVKCTYIEKEDDFRRKKIHYSKEMFNCRQEDYVNQVGAGAQIESESEFRVEGSMSRREIHKE